VAQTLFAVVIMVDLRLHWYGGLLLFGLFVAGFVWPDEHVALSFVYLALAVVAAVVQRREMGEVLRYVRQMLRPATRGRSNGQSIASTGSGSGDRRGDRPPDDIRATPGATLSRAANEWRPARTRIARSRTTLPVGPTGESERR